jgi:pimeloyl-ACP methyl ester carboxylesterase
MGDDALTATDSGTIDLPSGISLHYERFGSGTPVVLIPGTGCDHTFWQLQIPFYAAEHDVIALDNRGGGQSTVPTDVDSYSAEAMAQDVIGLLDALRIDRAHLAGHSLGSCIAQHVALLDQSRVRSLQLHATWAKPDRWLSQAFIGTTRYPLALGDLQATFKAVTMWMLSPEYLETRQPPRVADAVTSTFITNPNLQANEGMLGHLHADDVQDTTERLGEITVPTLVTAGAADVLIPPRYGRRVAELIPGAQFHEFPGERSSHAYPWELEEDFNTVTCEFWRACDR